MASINLRELFHCYPIDCFVEVPDSDAEAFKASITRKTGYIYLDSQRTENTYQRKFRRHITYFSSDSGDGIERVSAGKQSDPFEVYVNKLTKKQLLEAVAALPDKQSKRVYAHYYLGFSKAAIARAEGVKESTIRESLVHGLINCTLKCNTWIC